MKKSIFQALPHNSINTSISPCLSHTIPYYTWAPCNSMQLITQAVCDLYFPLHVSTLLMVPNPGWQALLTGQI